MDVLCRGGLLRGFFWGVFLGAVAQGWVARCDWVAIGVYANR